MKQFIDGMRTSRDTKMAELNALKTQLKEQNQRLLQVTQERAKIESKNKVNQKIKEEGLGKNWQILHDHSNILLVQVSDMFNFKVFTNIFSNLCFPCLELPEPEPYEIRNNFAYISSLSAHCVKSLVPEGK